MTGKPPGNRTQHTEDTGLPHRGHTMRLKKNALEGDTHLKFSDKLKGALAKLHQLVDEGHGGDDFNIVAANSLNGLATLTSSDAAMAMTSMSIVSQEVERNGNEQAKRALMEVQKALMSGKEAVTVISAPRSIGQVSYG